MLEPFGEEIWLADGPEVVAALGFHYPTRMAVIRLGGEALFIWSPIALSDGLRAKVDALGTVRSLIAPNSLHHVFLAEWQRAYPEVKLYAAPGLQKKRRDLDLDGELGDAPEPQWAGEIDQVVMSGNAITTEIVFFHRQSGTVLFTDLLQQFPDGWFSGWRSIVARWDRMTTPELSVPRKFRVAFTNRKTARASLGRILDWPSEKVVVAHGEPVREDGRAVIRRAFGWLS